MQVCLHERVAEMAQRQPDAPAVYAWDGYLTYSELSAQAATLVYHLVELGVRPETMIALCMNKSQYAIIAMLAILQAGGVVLPLSLSHPLKRIKGILSDNAAKIILVDHGYTESLVGLLTLPIQLVTVDSTLLASLSAQLEAPTTIVTPGNAAWVIYTSGSTGAPKGVILEHASLSTSLQAHGAAFGIGPHTRAAQFAAYTFDVSISDIFAVLHHGGCVCVFSEENRINNLTQALQNFRVNYVNLTPTVVRLLDPENLPLIKTVVVGGEPLDPNIVRKWSSHAKVFNSFGPSECAIISTCHGPLTDPNTASNVGFPTGTRLWVTKVTNPKQLCPIGASGELLIDGPLLARGYLNDPHKTAGVFITNPGFMQILNVLPGHRFYRTGDLVR